MSRKRVTTQQIIHKLRATEVELAEGKPVPASLLKKCHTRESALFNRLLGVDAPLGIDQVYGDGPQRYEGQPPRIECVGSRAGGPQPEQMGGDPLRGRISTAIRSPWKRAFS